MKAQQWLIPKLRLVFVKYSSSSGFISYICCDGLLGCCSKDSSVEEMIDQAKYIAHPGFSPAGSIVANHWFMLAS